MKRYIVISAVFAASALTSYAGDNEAATGNVLHTQDMEEVLFSVRANNPELLSIEKSLEAQIIAIKGENMPEDPSVEYSSFYSSSVSGQSGSELVVSQGFEFPTLYAARHKRNELSQEALGKSFDNERRRILLDAKLLCHDIIMYRQIGELLNMQSEIAEDLLALYQQRLVAGDASVLEVNKIKMELMSVATSVSENNAALDAACRRLDAMNGGQGIVFDADFYPLVEDVADKEAAVAEYLSEDASVAAAENAAEAARKDVSISRQGWIPRFEVGYRRNTAIREAEHGFLVGGSIPLFSNQRKVAMAKARSAAAVSSLNAARLQSESEVRSLLNEIDQTRNALDAYDEPLMRETLDLLGQAVEGGEISLIDYFVEASSIYTNLTACITLKNGWHKLMARLYKNRL
ncbi:MAG: TolC family protein [Bacteroidetes bacterium]|uniref:TolC family protein n=1 Tax=Candidatus Cryptobacteroides excrementavium TaxID=2840759 RepID=A0A9D9NSB8_9BACT|nr:TolC family protein [Candidatus Cryptobacteroides excrementavium]